MGHGFGLQGRVKAALPGKAAVLCILAVLVFTGCVPRRMVVNEISGLVAAGIPALERDDDLIMLEQALPANIKLLEALLESDPENRRLLVLLARLYGSYGFLFAEADYERETLAPDRGRGTDGAEALNRYYLKGASYALEALAGRHPDCREKLKKVAGQQEFFASLEGPDVPALFWYGFNLGLYVNLNRASIRVVSKAHIAEKAMLRVAELDPGYQNGGPHLFLLVYYASRSPMMGGSPAKALDHYRRLKELAGEGFLLADLFYARYYLHQQQDRQGFTETLQRILAAPEGPDRYRLYNRAAQVRAEIYLKAVDDLFA